MSYETIGDWITSAKTGALAAPVTPNVKVIRSVPKSKGNIIMEVAEILRPWLTKMLDGVRDNKGMLVQPANIRALALNVAQDVVNKHETK